jgi:cell division protein FtsL
MKTLKRLLRTGTLILFMMLALTGIGITGIAPTLTKDRKLFAEKTQEFEVKEKAKLQSSKDGLLKF